MVRGVGRMGYTRADCPVGCSFRSHVAARRDHEIARPPETPPEQTLVDRGAGIGRSGTGRCGSLVAAPDGLLSVKTPAVEPQESAMLQYWYAYRMNTEDAWLAVERNFPQNDPVNRVYALQAKQRLAELYRDTDQPQHAMALYTELASLDGEEPQFAASGLIGQANLLAQQGDGPGANAKLAQAMQLIEALPRKSQKESVLMLLDQRVMPLLDPNLRAKIDNMMPPGRRPGPDVGGQ